jgi:hypothetical protein
MTLTTRVFATASRTAGDDPGAGLRLAGLVHGLAGKSG